MDEITLFFFLWGIFSLAQWIIFLIYFSVFWFVKKIGNLLRLLKMITILAVVSGIIMTVGIFVASMIAFGIGHRRYYAPGIIDLLLIVIMPLFLALFVGTRYSIVLSQANKNTSLMLSSNYKKFLAIVLGPILVFGIVVIFVVPSFLSEQQHNNEPSLVQGVLNIHFKDNAILSEAKAMIEQAHNLDSEISELNNYKNFKPTNLYLRYDFAPASEKNLILEELKNKHTNEVTEIYAYSPKIGWNVTFSSPTDTSRAKEIMLSIRGIEEPDIYTSGQFRWINVHVPFGEEEKWIDYFKTFSIVKSVKQEEILPPME